MSSGSFFSRFSDHKRKESTEERRSDSLIHSLRSSKSKRFTKLNFKGFSIGSPSNLGRLLRSWVYFSVFLASYIVNKLRLLLATFSLVFSIWGPLFLKLKAKSVQKLIWSRGRLGRPVINFVVFTFAFLVFTVGKIFNSSPLVNSARLNEDYLSSVSDIIPQREVATTLVPESRKRTEYFDYTVQAGDTLSGIGQKFKISSDALKYVNNLTDSSILKVGNKLSIPPVSGLIHKVESGDTLASIAKKYAVPEQAVADFNYILDTSSLAMGTELVIPDAKVPQPVYIPAFPTLPQFTQPVFVPNVGSGWCMWPTTTRIITQYFSWYHNGLDIATPWGAQPPLFACASGNVTRAGWDPWGLGLHVQIDHDNGFATVYGHMARIDVGYGQRVGQGEVIGIMGNTGRSTGPHVHFIIKFNGAAQNPLEYIN